MISKKLILFKQYFLYEGKKYTIDEFFNNINEIYKNLKIIIAENEMFISQYKLEDNNVTVFLDNIMMNNEVNNENILTDYYYNKRKKILYLYSLNEGKYINKIANDKTIVKVIPIQFYIRNILKIALYRKSKVLVITKIHKNIYAIISEKGCITYSNILTNDKNVLNNEILKFAKDIEIGDGSWIGGATTINPGVKIGKNVVIGSGSVVTKDIPDNTIAVGNPCRVIKTIDKE